MAVASNMCVTGKRPRDNHAVRFREVENQESSQGHAADQRHLGLQRGASIGTPWLLEEGMGQEEVASLSICLSIYLSANN